MFIPERKIGKRVWLGRGVILLFFISYFVILYSSVKHIDNELKKSTATSLRTVLKSVTEALFQWKINTIHRAESISRNSKIHSYIKNGKDETPEFREELQKLLVKNNFEGFYLVGSDLVNINSSEKEEIGKDNVLKDSMPRLLRKVFGGSSTFVPTTWSDSKTGNRRAAAFILVPIENGEGINKVLALKISPQKEYSRICKIGRIGETGETYAFDKQARLLTESRFKEMAVKIGLIKDINSDLLNIQIRNPGKNLVLNGSQLSTQEGLPLTVMATYATEGISGVDVDGYRDYRGVPVYGAWLWDEDLHLGLTTEIDKEEADKPIFLYKKVSYVLTGLLGIISILVIIILRGLSKKVENELKQINVGLEERVEEKSKELIKANKAKEKLFAVIAHDLRNPIGTISSILKEVEEGKMAIDNELIEILSNSSSTAYYLLEDLLTWSLSQQDSLRAVPDNFDFNKVVEENQKFYKAILHKKAIDLKVERLANNTNVFGDYRLCNTVLRNLINNAIKFSKPDGQIIIWLKTRDKHLLIEIQDFGIGISEKNQKHLFDLQNNVTTDGTLKEKGTGIGLPLCKDFIDRNNGEFEVESELGAGSTFKFTIPLGNSE